MAEISSGNDDKSIGKASSKLFGRSPSSTPGRSLSKKKSNPFSRIFSRKKPEKQNVANYESDSSSSSDGDTGKPEEIDASSVTEQTERHIPKVIEVGSHGAETFGQEKTNANTIPESKESIPATDEEKKPDIVSKLKEVAENSKEEILEKGKEGLKEVFKALTTHEQPLEKTPVEEKLEKGKEQPSNNDNNNKEEKPSNNNEPLLPLDDAEKKTTQLQEKITAAATTTTTTIAAATAKLDETAQAPSSSSQKLQEEAVAVVSGVTQQQREEENRHGETQENVKEEDNCVASLAEGLQKMCATWNKDNKDD